MPVPLICCQRPSKEAEGLGDMGVPGAELLLTQPAPGLVTERTLLRDVHAGGIKYLFLLVYLILEQNHVLERCFLSHSPGPVPQTLSRGWGEHGGPGNGSGPGELSLGAPKPSLPRVPAAACKGRWFYFSGLIS